MRAEDLEAELRKIHSEIRSLRVALEALLAVIPAAVDVTDKPEDAAAAGFERYRARLKRGGA